MTDHPSTTDWQNRCERAEAECKELREGLGASNMCEAVFVHDPFSDLWAHLEYAASRLSDAMMGGQHSSDEESVLRRVAQRESRLIHYLCLTNRVLREISRRRLPVSHQMEAFEMAARSAYQNTTTNGS